MRIISKKRASFDAGSRRPGTVKYSVWVNGRLIDEAKAGVSVLNSAYLYGIGIFETLRVQAGSALFFRLHFERMRKNARRIGLRIPFGSKRLSREVRRVLRANHLEEATLRIILSERDAKPDLVLIAKPYLPYPKRCYERGAKLVIARTVQADAKSVAAIKTTSYLTKMLARREARRRGADEAILLDANGHVTEGASSNIFIVKKGRLFTPPLSDGLLPGTRRDIVLNLARRLKIPVTEKSLTVRDLKTAEEIFITSTLKDLMPVGKAPGPVTRRLIGAYWEMIR